MVNFVPDISIMLYTILHNWTFFRFLRLAMGMLIIVQGILGKDWFFALAGLAFSLMALFNTGCCAGSSCAAPISKYTDSKKDITYEEVD